MTALYAKRILLADDDVPAYSGGTARRTTEGAEIDHVRARIVGALRTDEALQVVAEAADGRSGIDLCLQHRPDEVTTGPVPRRGKGRGAAGGVRPRDLAPGTR